ncbi:pyrimidine reductase family protein [Sphaerimonospora cavernae]|uniref:Pyrimidine reductase family protein n=1 Tax=Sphaerimonospora cavernae TaxID=1740611 RepID=A0ABV6U8J3_9ACTN
MRRIHPYVEDDPDLAAAYGYPREGCLRVNMVASADGAAWLEGRSAGLSSPGDRRIFHYLRGLADVVLAGAGTVRTEGYGPSKPRAGWPALRAGRPPAPPIALVTRRLDLDLRGPLFTEAEPYQRTIVITTRAAPRDRLEEAGKNAEVLVAGEELVDMAVAVRLLRERGLGRILCEGGPRLNAELAAAGLIDELVLTISPLLAGGDAARVLNGVVARTPLALAHVLEEDGVLFTRYVSEGAAR